MTKSAWIEQKKEFFQTIELISPKHFFQILKSLPKLKPGFVLFKHYLRSNNSDLISYWNIPSFELRIGREYFSAVAFWQRFKSM